jgi:hypothetical protein
MASLGKEFRKFGSAVIGNESGESGESGRQLEQQCHQLPHREPQQQPDELELQHRIPGGQQLRPPVPDGRLKQGLNRPPSCSSGQVPADETQPVPP